MTNNLVRGRIVNAVYSNEYDDNPGKKEKAKEEAIALAEEKSQVLEALYKRIKILQHIIIDASYKVDHDNGNEERQTIIQEAEDEIVRLINHELKDFVQLFYEIGQRGGPIVKVETSEWLLYQNIYSKLKDRLIT